MYCTMTIVSVGGLTKVAQPDTHDTLGFAVDFRQWVDIIFVLCIAIIAVAITATAVATTITLRCA